MICKGIFIIVTLLLAGCSTKTPTGSLNITIEDLTSPVITVTDKAITEGDSLKLEDCYTVIDNMDKEPTVLLDGEKDLDTKTPGIYKVKIIATDSFGNSSEATLTITVKEKPKPTPTPTPGQTSETDGNSNNNANSSNNTPTYNTPTQTQPEQQTQPSYQEQAQEENTGNESTVKQYVPESTGYTTTETYPDISGCQAAMLRHPNNSGCNYSNGEYVISY